MCLLPKPSPQAGREEEGDSLTRTPLCYTAAHLQLSWRIAVDGKHSRSRAGCCELIDYAVLSSEVPDASQNWEYIILREDVRLSLYFFHMLLY